MFEHILKSQFIGKKMLHHYINYQNASREIKSIIFEYFSVISSRLYRF